MNRFLRWLAPWRRLPPPLPRIAVFVDGDGVSPKDAERVIGWVEQYGRVIVLRAYGNYTGRAAASWAGLIRRRGIVARHMPNMTPGKNAADIALTIDAIELLLTREIDIYVLIVSDTDFVPLANRIREEGKEVIGFGQRSTPETFRLACTEFREIRSLGQTAPAEVPSVPFWSRTPHDAEELVLGALTDMCSSDGPVALSVLGARLLERDPGFDPRSYGSRTLRDLLSALPRVELTDRDGAFYARPASVDD